MAMGGSGPGRQVIRDLPVTKVGWSGRGRNYRRSFDLDLGAVLEQRCHLHQSHCRVMPAKNLAVSFTDVRITSHVVALVDDIPCQSHDMFWAGTGLCKYTNDIAECLTRLVGNIVA